MKQSFFSTTMKIAILNRYQNVMSRGAETFVIELASRLSKNNQVDIFASKDADSLTKIISGKYDVVIPMNGRMQVLKTSLGRIFGGYKLVITGQSGIGKDDIFRVAVGRPDAFVALTDYAAGICPDEKLNLWSWINRKGRVASTWGWGCKIIKIPNGVDTNKFKPVGEKYQTGLKRPLVLSVGALTWYKHHERTIEAVAKLSNVSLLIVGKGELESDLSTLAKKKLGDRFKIISAPFEDLPKIYRAADLFVLPSWDREAFGIVYIEAMASGLPVVAPNDLPRKEIIGSAGILVDVSDPDKYAQAIQDALTIKWQNIPREQAENFDWSKIAHKYEELFRSLVNK